MTELGTVLAVVVGGAITLLGTVLANYLQNLSEKRRRKRERVSERLEEVRHYVASCLVFADMMYGSLSGVGFGGQQELFRCLYDLRRFAKEADFGPVAGSRAVLFVDDDALENMLKQFRGLVSDMRFDWHASMKEVRDTEEGVRDWEKNRKLISVVKGDREKIKKLARGVQARCEELIDEAC